MRKIIDPYKEKGTIMHQMQRMLTELYDTIHTMHRLPKLLLKYGGMLVIFLFTASAAAYLCAGRLGNYYALAILSNDLFVCGRDTLSAALVPALLIEIVLRAGKADGR